MGGAGATTPARLLIAAVWDGAPVAVDGSVATLEAAWRLAVANEVEADLAGYYPTQLAARRRRVAAHADAFRRNLAEATDRLAAAGIPAVLVKCRPDEDLTYTNFDLVVGPRRFQDAVAALRPWTVRTETHRLEPDKILLHPADGPAAHLHQHIGWFGVPVIPGDAVLARAAPATDGAWHRPSPADDLRSYLAHAAFQNLAIPLRELRAVRHHCDGDTVALAARHAQAEGWLRTYRRVVSRCRDAVRRLDAGQAVALPVWLTPGTAVLAGVEHARSRWRAGDHATAVRELALRGPLFAAKTRRRWRRP